MSNQTLPTPQTYEVELKQALDHLLQLMRQTWGDAPEVTVTVEAVPMLYVRTHFNMKEFAHKGRGFWIKLTNVKRRSPKQIARAIAEEVAVHRDTCDRCGVPRRTLRDRVYAHRYQTRGFEPGTSADTPPDVVEMVIHPRLSRELQQHLNGNHC